MNNDHPPARIEIQKVTDEKQGKNLAWPYSNRLIQHSGNIIVLTKLKISLTFNIRGDCSIRVSLT